ncbi:MAG TPA: hypothetical protein DDY18_04585 [Flavobacterium sp.]|jgi:hypothetical protein|nr:hypothetical protein [Flavobacterium sp.]
MGKGNKYFVTYFQNANFHTDTFIDKKTLNAFLSNFTIKEPGDEIMGVFYGKQLTLKAPVSKLSYELDSSEQATT